MCAVVETFCFSCKKVAHSATKIPDNLHLQTLTAGDVFCRHTEPFANCIIRLKEPCKCGKDIAIGLQGGVYTRAEPSEHATWAEGPWASMDPIERAN
jgi:hypothetical protein